MGKVVLVDKNDRVLGLHDKLRCHSGKGMLHRAFSVFVFNSRGELLLQQRSKRKLLWPLYWSNTCCSHPQAGESYERAGQRRLQTEMGFTCPLKKVGIFQYKAEYKDRGSENELCAVLVGKHDGEVSLNSEEVAIYKWRDFQELKEDIEENPDNYTPWLKLEIEKFFL